MTADKMNFFQNRTEWGRPEHEAMMIHLSWPHPPFPSEPAKLKNWKKKERQNIDMKMAEKDRKGWTRDNVLILAAKTSSSSSVLPPPTTTTQENEWVSPVTGWIGWGGGGGEIRFSIQWEKILQEFDLSGYIPWQIICQETNDAD